MLTSIEETFRNGQIVLEELPTQILNETPVIVTFIGSNEIDLRAHNINQGQTAELRSSLGAFEDWDEPEMDIYDDYNNAKANLLVR